MKRTFIFSLAFLMLVFFVTMGVADAKQNSLRSESSYGQSGELFDDFWMGWSQHMDRVWRHFHERMQEIDDGQPFDFVPNMDVLQKEEEMVVSLDLPGVKKEDIQIEIEEDTLKVQGTRKNEWVEEAEINESYLYRGSKKYGTFLRILKLPNDVDQTQVDATFKNGILEITFQLKEKEAREPIQIAIK